MIYTGYIVILDEGSLHHGLDVDLRNYPEGPISQCSFIFLNFLFISSYFFMYIRISPCFFISLHRLLEAEALHIWGT